MQISDIDIDRLSSSHFAVGFAGGLVALRFVPGISWWERAGNVLAGGLCAHFLTPALAEWLQWQSPQVQGALAFGVGLFGLAVAAALLDGIRQTRVGEAINNWLNRPRG